VQPVLVTVNFLDGQIQNLEKSLCQILQYNIAPRRQLWLYHAVSGQTPVNASGLKRCRLRIFYSGTVQGVGFRYTTKTVATGFEVTGTVRNLPDGRVEVIAEGVRAELEAFRTAIRDAGLSGFIRDENVSWSDAQNELRGFEIIR
jgi:acylphosphatase